jgi:hypothetical protein
VVPDGSRWNVRTEVSKLMLCHIEISKSGRIDNVCVEINDMLRAVMILIHGGSSDSESKVTSYQ